MKIGITGTHGIGKTDICNLLSYILQKRGHTHIIVEVVRHLIDQGIKINESTTIDSQTAVQYAQRLEEIIAEHRLGEGKYSFIICDRTVIDNYIYMERKFGLQKKFVDSILDWLKTNSYDFLFKVPIWSEEIKKDNVRDQDRDFQRDIDQRLDEFLERYKIKHFILPKEYFKKQEKEQFNLFYDYFKNILNLNNL